MRVEEARSQARPYKDALRRSAPAGVVGVGYGAKVTGGCVLGEPCVRVYVRAKRPLGDLRDAERVPTEVEGLPTDVVPVGDVRALSAPDRVRPAPGGVSVAHEAVSAGTLGCLVARDDDPGPFILSNNHVLAASNEGEVDDPILQPGPADGGTAADRIARLADWVPIDFEGDNTVDAALGRVEDPSEVTAEIRTIEQVDPEPMSAALYQSVRKHGRTTLHTVGVVMDVAADIDVRFNGRTVSFVDQIAIVGAGGVFSDGGDSGSLVVDGVERRPVGLLFAGGRDLTFANPVDAVFDAFNAQVLAEVSSIAQGS